MKAIVGYCFKHNGYRGLVIQDGKALAVSVVLTTDRNVAMNEAIKLRALVAFFPV